MYNFIPSSFQNIRDANGGETAKMVFSPALLYQTGFIFPVLVSTPASPAAKIVPRSETVFALLDTGATSTSIDIRLAERLELPVWGATKINTADGLKDSALHLGDISFPYGNLRGIRNLSLASCKLPYDPEQPQNIENFALLIGRDIMAHWTIVWNGPSSSVIIAD